METATLDEVEIVRALRERDEAAFAALAREYHGSLLRVAQIYVSSRAVAEEVVQETWIGVLNGLDRFEGLSSDALTPQAEAALREAFREWSAS